MERSGVLGIIPARIASTRLPNKPLHSILGRPLILWVWERMQAMSVLDRVVVATDSPEVMEVCHEEGAEVILTSSRHPSGTDRVAEVARQDEFQPFQVIVNIQGDEPLIREDHVRAAAELVAEGRWEVGTCAAPVQSLEARHDPSVVKVARALDGRALYFSRCPIPYKRDEKPTEDELHRAPFLRHLGIYAYSHAALEAWVALSPSPLEELERLEQLRPLEAGVRIGVALVGEAEPGVDTPADVIRVEARMRALGIPSLAERRA